MSSAADRLSQAISHLTRSVPSLGHAKLLIPHENDVVVVAALRTAITKAKKGGFKDTLPEELLSGVLRALYKSVDLDPALIEDVAVGNVLPPKGGAYGARMAALHAGIPNTSAINTVNRQCGSGLSAINQIANEIMTGQIDIGIGAGVESMTANYGPAAMSSEWSSAVLTNQEAADCLIPMGIMSENVAEQYSISREAQDAFAASSFRKAAAAQKAGKFKAEIVPLEVKWNDPTTAEEKRIIVDADDGIRDGVTVESLSKLKPAFKETGSTHAGNASQVSDGAAAVLLARRGVAKKLGLPILGKLVNADVVGVPPRINGIGPAVAIPKVLESTGLSKEDVDFYEINEAFASQVVMCIEHIGLPYDKVNPVGGAIALGHPLGSTGARQVATAFSHAKRTGKKIFITSMCIGSGMGMAAVFVNEQETT